jgi:hypothetical protein
MFSVKIFITKKNPAPCSGVFKEGAPHFTPTKIAKLYVYGGFYLRQNY